MEKKEIEVEGATVPFYQYEQDGNIYYEFDSSMCEPPGPMVNAMSGLKLLDAPNKRVVMINHKKPMGLLPKIEGDFEWDEQELDDGKIKLIFRLKGESADKTDFDDSKCSG